MKKYYIIAYSLLLTTIGSQVCAKPTKSQVQNTVNQLPKNTIQESKTIKTEQTSAKTSNNTKNSKELDKLIKIFTDLVAPIKENNCKGLTRDKNIDLKKHFQQLDAAYDAYISLRTFRNKNNIIITEKQYEDVHHGLQKLQKCKNLRSQWFKHLQK